MYYIYIYVLYINIYIQIYMDICIYITHMVDMVVKGPGRKL